MFSAFSILPGQGNAIGTLTSSSSNMELFSPLILNYLSQVYMFSNQNFRAKLFLLREETTEVTHGECKRKSHGAQGDREENIPSRNSRDKKESAAGLI